MGIINKIPVFLYLLIAPFFLSAGNPHEIAQGVLDRLYQVNGHFNPHKPKLEIVNSIQNVASYGKYNNTIQLELQAYNLCRSFGKDSLDALAFILGHELIHAIQINNVLPKTSFVSYDKSQKSSLQIEQNADIQGIFVSYLAGFKTIQLIPQIIDKMYTVYELRSKNIKGYPTEDERKSSYKTVKEQANELIELFNLANEMSIIEEYQASIQCLEYISKFYQGKEIYNNLGINYALMALNFTNTNAESYIYPIELDWNSRIKKPRTGRGDELVDTIEKQAQMHFFMKAKDYFSLASDLDPNYTLADLNSFSVLIMMNDLQNANKFYRNQLRSFSDKPQQRELFQKIKMANAILMAKMKNTTEAKKIWTDLLQAKNPVIAGQAEQNLRYISKNKLIPIKKTESECIKVNLTDVQDYSIKLRSPKTEPWIQLDSSKRIERKKLINSTIYACVEDDWNTTRVQKIAIPSGYRLDVKEDQLFSLGNNQWIYQCKKEKEAYVLNDNHEIVYLIRYRHIKEVD